MTEKPPYTEASEQHAHEESPAPPALSPAMEAVLEMGRLSLKGKSAGRGQELENK